MAKKIQFETRHKTIVLDYEKDWGMIGYYSSMYNYGKYLKWHQKLTYFMFCKSYDLKRSIVKGLRGCKWK